MDRSFICYFNWYCHFGSACGCMYYMLSLIHIYRMIALTAAAVLAVSLTACGSKAEEPAAADTKTEAAEDTASADTTGDKKVLKVAMECGYAPYNLSLIHI